MGWFSVRDQGSLGGVQDFLGCIDQGPEERLFAGICGCGHQPEDIAS